jgi:hypothetical protein
MSNLPKQLTASDPYQVVANVVNSLLNAKIYGEKPKNIEGREQYKIKTSDWFVVLEITGINK